MNQQIDEKQMAQLQKQEEQKAQQEETIKQILTQILTPGARERLANIKIVRPEKASAIEMQLCQAAQSGQLKQAITEQQLILMLEKMDGGRVPQSKVQYKRHTLSSDEEDM